MMPSNLLRWAPMFSLFGLLACATPQAALDQANNAAALTVSLQGELRNL